MLNAQLEVRFHIYYIIYFSSNGHELNIEISLGINSLLTVILMAVPSSNSLSWLPAALTGGNAGLDALKLENIEFKNLIYTPGDDPDSGGLGEESYKGGWRDGQVSKHHSYPLPPIPQERYCN